MNDTIHGLISLTEYEKRIISTIGFNRLHDVYQNSTVYLTFPTNRTKRFEHSIGTMKLCSDMFYYSLLNTSDAMIREFYQVFEREYADILEKIATSPELYEDKLGRVIPKQLPQIEFDRLRHSLIPNNVPETYKVMHLILIESIRAAALLHDIGHPPFSHIVEFALKKVYMEYKDKEVGENEQLDEFLAIMSQYFEGNRKLHEQMGDEIAKGILSKIIAPIKEDPLRYDENLFEVLILESVERIFSEQGAFAAIHKILDASLDGDRLDYVTRDSLNSGMDSGKLEYSRIIHELRLMMKDGEIFFCVPLKAVNSVEDFIKRRYNSYKDIIYHHRVIKTDFLLEGIVKELVKKYLDQEIPKSPREHEVVIPFDISGLWFPLGDKKAAIKANALSQWNDSWLMTVLKQIYYTEYYHNASIKEGTKEYILAQRLAEFLRNSKRYYSLMKRSENFKVIDDAVKCEIIKKKTQLQGFLVSVLPGEDNKKQEFVRCLLEKASNQSSGFILSFMTQHYRDIGIKLFERTIEEIVIEETNQVLSQVGIKTYDTVTLFKRISIGLDEPIYFYNNKEEISTLKEISGISDILQLDSDYLPVFYIYILAKDADEIIACEREKLLERIGTRIGVIMAEKIILALQKMQ